MNIYHMTNRFKLNLINKILTVTILCFGIGNLWGQQEGSDPHQYNNVERYYPKAPGSSSFEKFINVPQANYTGIHGFSVPIHTISIKDEKFPVSINYHGMGINVNEISGILGNGWDLNIGGVNLSQEVRGHDDFVSVKIDLEKGTDFYSGNVYPPDELGNPAGPQYINAIKVGGGYSFIQSGSYPGVLYEMNPDFFNYSLLNNNGRYIIDGDNGNIQTIPRDNISTSKIGKDQIIAPVLVDKKGIIYYFERYEHSETGGGPYQAPIKSHNYKLNSIYFPDTKKTMYFTYVQTSYNYNSNEQHSITIDKWESSSPNPLLVSNPGTSTTNTSVLKEYLIETIIYEDTKLEFVYADGKPDVNNGGKKLTKIFVKHKPLVGAEKIIKEYNIDTSVVSQRLRLNSITELLSTQTYSFEYDNSKILPSRFSSNVDWWGSFTKSTDFLLSTFNFMQPPNVSIINNSHLPSFKYKRFFNEPEKYFFGANKEPDIEFAQVGALTKVNLPTGGSQIFEYELDDYKFDSEEREYSLFFLNTDSWSSQSSTSNILPIQNSSSGDPNIPDYPDFRTKGLDYKLLFSTNYENCNYVPGNTTDIPIGRHFRFELYNQAANNQLVKNGIINNGTVVQLDEFDPNGTYYLKIIQIGTDRNCAGTGYQQPSNAIITPQINWVHESDPIHKNNKQAGHLRVKSISLDEDSDGIAEIKKIYEYKNFKNPEFSSGVFMGLPINSPLSIASPGGEGTPNPTCPHCPSLGQTVSTSISSNPALNLNSSYGKSVFYENVTEIYVDNTNSSNNYKKEFVFQVPDTEDYPEYRAPVIYWPHNEYTGGNILEERFYNDQDVIVKKIINEEPELDYHFNAESAYNDPQVPEYIGFGVAAALLNTELRGCMPSCSYVYYHATNVYFIPSAWVKNKKTTEENYNNGTLWMTNTTEYEYDSGYNHLNPVSVTQTNSLGQEVKTEYEYTHPYKKGEPTIVRQFENGIATSVQETKFYAATGLPQYVFAKRAASSLDNVPPSDDLKVTYNRYDVNGNLEQYTMENGIPVCIVWGYNKQYPIAKIEGIAYTSLPSTPVGLAVTASNNDVDASTENTLRTRLQELRQHSTLANLMVTTYTYDPLVGVTSITSPGGQTEYYIYDTAGRLQKVVDHEQKEVRKIDYHYKD